MTTKAELAEGLTVDQLKDLAHDHDVDISQAGNKSELVEAVVAGVSKDDLVAAANGDYDSPDSAAAETTADSLDPMLVDPAGEAAKRAEGRTSDAALRTEGNTASDVKPDLPVGEKPSDAGADLYPYPVAGDVEVATVDPGDGADEFQRPLEVEDWVVLGEHELVPDRLVGRRAAVLQAPREPWSEDDRENTWLLVRTRDDANATLSIPLTAVSEIQRGGVSPLVRG